ncbi:class I SAM-dependent methyltransferase [Mycoplasmopsis gallopavonis]|uniref:Ribosomal protein L11 methyltransferase n=1 Tax=Mycoplasmopsis gallopavonis TaxID=76629 RepID=A0A449AYQ6_9BACT|nr:class I SAM-dependent methyltransferase [Mycoplasmopsis gallopavonis]RIV16223.1 class I SAM-dependent methyltransferase [Mycoplasmopsis gallopavonis]VEU72622.1 ribosomal protein L11 methyltransferase [Mycoplasmopsis gallopavonis]VEU72985.1 ribosomal protein L11 methyltransferase [Mycoplasmopsis gallopavonis]
MVARDEDLINAYQTETGQRIYTRAVFEVGLWKSEEKLIKKYAKTTDLVLDLGTGSGRVAFALKDLGYTKVIATDLSSELIKNANYIKENNNYQGIDFYLTKNQSLKFLKNNSVDFAFYSFNGLMCVPLQDERIKILKEVERVLKKNSYFIFTAKMIEGDLFLEKYIKEQEEKQLLRKLDPRIELIGDSIYLIDGKEGFLHFSYHQELEDLIKKYTNFEVIETKTRDELANENEFVKKFSDNTTFWVLRKI